MIMIAAMLICCSSPRYVILTTLTGGENLTCPEPCGESEFGESQVDYDTRLPWYTSGFD